MFGMTDLTWLHGFISTTYIVLYSYMPSSTYVTQRFMSVNMGWYYTEEMMVCVVCVFIASELDTCILLVQLWELWFSLRITNWQGCCHPKDAKKKEFVLQFLFTFHPCRISKTLLGNSTGIPKLLSPNFDVSLRVSILEYFKNSLSSM